MKKLLLIFLILQASVSSFAKCKSGDVSILSTKRDVFYFKINKVLLGATIEVYSSKGELIFTSKITHRKAIVDFYEEGSDTYSIRLRKNDRVEEFTYIKESSSPLVPVKMESANPAIVLAH